MRYDLEDFADHISYNRYTKDEKGFSLGENWIKTPELTETLIIGGYVYTWSQYYRNSSASDFRLHEIFNADVNRLSVIHAIASENNKYWVALAMAEFIKSVSKYGILLDSKQLFFIEWKNIKVHDEKVSDIIIKHYKEHGYPILTNAPTDVLIVFKSNQNLLIDYLVKCKEMGLKEIAQLFDHSKELALDHGWKKAIFDYFVWPKVKESGDEYEGKRYNNLKKQFDRAIKHH